MTQKDPLCFKIVLLGENYVGKTCIFHQMIHHEFCNYGATIGAYLELYSSEVDSRPINVWVVDTPGNERFDDLSPFHSRGAAGAIVIYDLEHPPTFDRLEGGWIRVFVETAGPAAKVAIVGNKADLVQEGGGVEERAMRITQCQGRQGKGLTLFSKNSRRRSSGAVFWENGRKGRNHNQ
jgi:small GTP-binding protein